MRSPNSAWGCCTWELGHGAATINLITAICTFVEYDHDCKPNHGALQSYVLELNEQPDRFPSTTLTYAPNKTRDVDAVMPKGVNRLANFATRPKAPPVENPLQQGCRVRSPVVQCNLCIQPHPSGRLLSSMASQLNKSDLGNILSTPATTVSDNAKINMS
jgi:hypothetical protein